MTTARVKRGFSVRHGEGAAWRRSGWPSSERYAQKRHACTGNFQPRQLSKSGNVGTSFWSVPDALKAPGDPHGPTCARLWRVSSAFASRPAPTQEHAFGSSYFDAVNVVKMVSRARRIAPASGSREKAPRESPVLLSMCCIGLAEVVLQFDPAQPCQDRDQDRRRVSSAI